MQATSEDSAPGVETRATRAQRTDHLLRLAAAETGASRRRLLDEVIRLNVPVAWAIARRYRGRGEPLDDLQQVAALGLVEAVRRFDPDRGNDFLSYALPTISGQVKRHFRDFTWTVRPPRRVQDLQARIAAAVDELTGQLRGSPTPEQVARFLDVETEHVIEALTTDGCFQTTSLDAPPELMSGNVSSSISDVIGREEDGYGATEVCADLALALGHLAPRDRLVLIHRVRDAWTQQQIAEELGMSQVHVSRVLTRVRGHLREAMRIAAG